MFSHTPRKRFGQNFLRDSSYVQRIISAVDPQKDDHCVEIGPGLGVLTKRLAPEVGHLDCIELDRDLAAKLQHDFRDAVPTTCQIYQADALDFDFASLLTCDVRARLSRPASFRPACDTARGESVYGGGVIDCKAELDLVCEVQRLRIIGNLPYNISTPLLFHVLRYANIVKDMHFMLQREVAWRLAASPGTKTYGRLSVMVQYYCAVELLFDVPPEAFSPRPAVHSTFVRLRPFVNRIQKANSATATVARPVASDVSILQKVTTHAFNQRRKFISNSLRTFITAAELESIGICPHLRPEQLTLQQFVEISNMIMDKH